MNCPTEAELLLLALADGAEEVALHARGCASCEAIAVQLRATVAGIRASAGNAVAGDGECLDELAVAEFVDGGGSSAQRDTWVGHLATCGHCRRELSVLVELLNDPAVAAESGQGVHPLHRTTTRRRFLAGAGLLAAAAALTILVWPGRNPAGPAHRGPTITAGSVPTPMSPVGNVADARKLRWTAVSGADRYRVTLFDATGKVLFDDQLTDTTTPLPDSVQLAPGQLYLWKVEARTAWERWASSELIEFRVTDDSTGHGSVLRPSSGDPPLSQSQDSLRQLAHRLSDSDLVTAVRNRPLEVREALTSTLALAVNGMAAARETELAVAHRLAVAYATAWHDEYLLREVDRFAAWPPERRASKVAADSLRRAGVAAYGRDGSAAAIAIWRVALARAVTIPDTAGMAATLGNIGAGFAHDDQPDSAEGYLQRSRVLAAAVGDIRVEANATSELAGVREQRADVGGARDAYAKAIILRQRIGDSRGLASDYNNLAGLARDAGDLDEAQRQLELALAINRREGRPEVAATNLVNLAALASLAGDFARAESLYREALTTWRVRRQWADAADALRGLGEMELRRGDYPAARADLLDALAIYDRTGPLTDALTVRELLAGVSAAAGDLQGALDGLRKAQHVADSAAVEPGVQAGLALARADLAAQLNNRPEARRLYASAERLFRSAGDRSGEAEAQEGQGMLLLEEGETARAKELFGAALTTELAVGNLRSASVTRLWLGQLALRQGDTTEARRQLATASAELARLGDPVAAAAALGERAALEESAGLPSAALALYRSALAAIGTRPAPEVTWRLHAGLGTTLRDRGAMDEASRQLRAAIADIEGTGHQLALAERRSGYLTDKWDVFARLALLERSRGQAGTAFEVSDRLRSSEMLELLAQGRLAEPPDTTAELVAKEQDLRRHIGELTSEMEGGSIGNQALRGPDLSRGGAVSREALLQAQASYAELMLEIREQAPRHAALVAPEAAAWRDVAKQLAPDQAFVEYLVSDQSTLAFLVTRDTLAVFTLGVGRQDLSRLVEFVRGTLEPRGSPSLDSLWRAPLRQLDADLVAPLEASGLLAGKTRLTIVPHAELHYLPFAALIGGAGQGQFLVERYQLMVTPSASVWLALGARPPAHATAGVLAFAPQPAELPASRREVAAIARLGGTDTRVVSGSAATEAAFRREAPTRRVIHLATYGVLNKQNPLFSFIEFAPDGTDDGRLEVHEVFGLDLAADLVVLSACQTGLASGALSDVPAGDDWVGLARAFLSAGAGSVIATLWPVQDRASAALMGRFYQGYTVGSDPGQALAAAQRALLAVPATANPYYWAGFELVGGR
jgi:CHAT domain-containing protein/tetratricopeptide (TPR) repeat protein